MERVMGIDESAGSRFGHLLVRVCAQTMDGLRPTHVREWVRRPSSKAKKMERVMGIDESAGSRFGHLLVRVCAQTMDGLRPTHVREWVRRPSSKAKKMERVMGIEPTLVAWEATVLPLNYTRFGL